MAKERAIDLAGKGSAGIQKKYINFELSEKKKILDLEISEKKKIVDDLSSKKDENLKNVLAAIRTIKEKYPDQVSDSQMSETHHLNDETYLNLIPKKISIVKNLVILFFSTLVFLFFGFVLILTVIDEGFSWQAFGAFTLVLPVPAFFILDAMKLIFQLHKSKAVGEGGQYIRFSRQGLEIVNTVVGKPSLYKWDFISTIKLKSELEQFSIPIDIIEYIVQLYLSLSKSSEELTDEQVKLDEKINLLALMPEV